MGCNSSNLVQQEYQQSKIPLMKLDCTECDITQIPLDGISNIKAIIVTDSHLGRFYPAETSIPKLFNHMKKVIELSGANCVFFTWRYF